MVRPRKQRRIGYKPEFQSYKPSKNKCIELTIEELETIRLMDYENSNQQEAADLMNIGRTTLQGIYKSAREKISIALIENISIKYKDDESYEFYSNWRHGKGQGRGRNRNRK